MKLFEFLIFFGFFLDASFIPKTDNTIQRHLEVKEAGHVFAQVAEAMIHLLSLCLGE